MNGVNIQHFQFERDLTWMAFFMNADDQFYARYGGREDHDPESHLTKKSLLRVMNQVLDLYKQGDVQTSRYEPKAAPRRIPEEIPTVGPLLNRRRNKCLHCHDVKNMELVHKRSQGEFSKYMVFTYPSPSRLGLLIDPDRQDHVKKVAADSPAAKAGLKAGDRLLAVDGQRILTFGDFARVLELTPERVTLPVAYERAGAEGKAAVTLSPGWRRSPDPSWRPSTGVAGPNSGFWARPMNEGQKRRLGLKPDALALNINFIIPNHPTPPARCRPTCK